MKYEEPKLNVLSDLSTAYCSTGSGNTGTNMSYTDCESGASANVLSAGGTICQPTGTGAAVEDTACISGNGDHGNTWTISCSATGSTPNSCSTGAYR